MRFETFGWARKQAWAVGLGAALIALSAHAAAADPEALADRAISLEYASAL